MCRLCGDGGRCRGPHRASSTASPFHHIPQLMPPSCCGARYLREPLALVLAPTAQSRCSIGATTAPEISPACASCLERRGRSIGGRLIHAANGLGPPKHGHKHSAIDIQVNVHFNVPFNVHLAPVQFVEGRAVVDAASLEIAGALQAERLAAALGGTIASPSPRWAFRSGYRLPKLLLLARKIAKFTKTIPRSVSTIAVQAPTL
jgi:hypothetical protein